MTAVPQFPQTLVPGAMATSVSAAYLVPVAGPPRPATELDPRRGAHGLMLGRHESCDLHLGGAEQVSRKHALFQFRPAGDSKGPEQGVWFISDAGSRWGTFLNGRRLQEGEEMPLRIGDQIRITPWTFLLSSTPMPRGLRIEAEPESATLVRNVRAADAVPLQQERLHLLLSSAAALHDARDEKELAARLLRLAQDGTSLSNGAVLKPLDTGGRFEVLASSANGSSHGGGNGFTFSRSLLDAARGGEVAEVRADDSVAPTSQSIVQMQITRALCVPILLGETPHMFLYLDQRGETVLQQHSTDQEAAVAFCIALSKIASLALSNLKRLDMELRAAELDADMKAAATAQQWIMPKREVSAGGYRIIGESRAGRGVGGDFFDLIELGRDKVAVALGDVSGKGVAAGVLMTATQGFLHAVLTDEHDLALVASQLNGFVHPRRPANRFVTLWIGIFDKSSARLTYVDAGHGLGILADGKGECQELSGGGGLPIGVIPDSEYTAVTVPFGDGDAVLVVSDGIVEQPAAMASADDRDDFGLSRTKQVLCRALASPDPVAMVFDAVVEHAGTRRLADDATVVLVRA
jgi:serine phosphatase RsbU (regulator of sigma subunit)